MVAIAMPQMIRRIKWRVISKCSRRLLPTLISHDEAALVMAHSPLINARKHYHRYHIHRLGGRATKYSVSIEAELRADLIALILRKPQHPK